MRRAKATRTAEKKSNAITPKRAVKLTSQDWYKKAAAAMSIRPASPRRVPDQTEIEGV